MEPTMFDTLLGLPLFQGLGHGDLTRILESTRPEFATLDAGQLLCEQDAPCEGLTFVLSGRVTACTLSADRQWSVEEELALPAVVGAESLYGSSRTHASTCRAAAPTRVMRLAKGAVAALTGYFEVFRINVLNLLSTTIARRGQAAWLPPAHTPEGRLTAFMRVHTTRPAGPKRFCISRRLLAAYMGTDPRRVSRALHAMEQAGLLELRRRTIVVDNFQRLLQAYMT